MNHSFDIDFAVKYGLHEAILIENLKFWIAKNKANKRHFYDGRYWTYNSAKALAELFPYMSEDQIQKKLKNLENMGVIVTGVYNQNHYDRTKWYAFSDGIDSAKVGNPFRKIAESLIDTDINTDKQCPHIEIIGLFAKHLPDLPQPRTELWGGVREESLRERWKWLLSAKKSDGTRYAENKEQALDWFGRFFDYVSKSDFLTGKDSKWSCDLGWLVKSENFAKVIQGNYENKNE